LGHDAFGYQCNTCCLTRTQCRLSVCFIHCDMDQLVAQNESSATVRYKKAGAAMPCN
jgi:hypothetical protein